MAARTDTGSSGERPEALFWMLAVAFPICEVVENVDTAGTKSKDDSSKTYLENQSCLRPDLTKEKTKEYEDVFGPLLGTNEVPEPWQGIKLGALQHLSSGDSYRAALLLTLRPARKWVWRLVSPRRSSVYESQGFLTLKLSLRRA